jgi:transcriptional regulator with XRE-family HTH domain
VDINDPVVLSLSREPKTRSQLACEYGVSVRTINRWLEDKNLKIPQGLICPNDLRIIYATLGPSKNINSG